MTDLVLKILYQDEHLIAIDKPEGLAVHRDDFSSRDQPACLQILRDQLGREVHPVHRLDAATSGALLFTFDRQILAAMMGQFMERRVEKIYHAIFRGWLRESVTCEMPMKKYFDKRHARSVDAGDGFQEASTVFVPVKWLEVPWVNEKFPMSRYTFVKVMPRTGRYHQIRRHACYLAHPIVGDTTRGDGDHNRLWRSNRSSHRLLLHASSIKVLHPVTGLNLVIDSELPKSFAVHLVELPWKQSLT